MCKCDEQQTDKHLLICTMNPTQCVKDNLVQVNKNAVNVATRWLQYEIRQNDRLLVLFIYLFCSKQKLSTY